MLNLLLNEQVTLIKQSGERFENIPASVQTGLVITQSPRIPIEDGDRFERRLPSGITQSLIVLDAGFVQQLPGLPAHYQSKVKKSHEVDPPAVSSHSIYNLIGPNARVNIQSSDSSTNVVNIDTAALFENLRKAVNDSIGDAVTKQQLTTHVYSMQAAVGSRDFATRYKEFISLAADHIAVFGPFMAALAQLLM